jgi:hypothetical protein
VNYLERKQWQDALAFAEARSDLNCLDVIDALLLHGELRIERRDAGSPGVVGGYVATLGFWGDDDLFRPTTAESGTKPTLEEALCSLSAWTRLAIDEMGIIARCSCGKAYSRQQWRALPGRRPWFIGDGEVLELRECSCRSTMSRRLRDPLSP